ncbi:MAG: hypothetical protein JKY42_10530 [Flavobacteriales bacterium]|nr:hypothetical protein [Flavobacteriales bacterium]
MKITKLQTATSLLVLVLLIGVTSCKKNKLNKQTTSSEDNSAAENMFDDIFNMTDKFDDTESDIDGSNKTSFWPKDTTYTHTVYSCLEITKQFIDSVTFERTITFNFGTTGCTTGDGRVRTGKIIAHRIGRYRDAASTTVITTDDYTVDDYTVDGTKTVTNLGENSANQQQYSVVVSGDIITPTGETITWNSTRTRTWIEGANTWFFGTLNDDGTLDSLYRYGVEGIYDDVWEVTGSGGGINREGRAFDVDITTALRVQWCAPYVEVTEGVIEVQPEDLKLRTVDFGDGICDNEATATIGNNSYTFEMRKN